MRTLQKLLALALSLVVYRLEAATIFTDGFESGTLGGGWTVSGTNNGRVAISTDSGPATGTSALVFDDSVSDAVYSVAEATLTLDLTNKKNVVLSFKVKSLGNEANVPPSGNFTSTRTYDGVAISTDGGVTWRTVQSLAAVGTAWESFSIPLDAGVALLGGGFGVGFRIRFSEYDNAPVPLDGMTIDDVSVSGDDDQRVVLELPTTLLEGTGPHIGYALLAFAPTTPLTLNLTANPAAQLNLPTTVEVPAGQSYVSFEFIVPDDALTNLARTVTVNATTPGAVSTPSTIIIQDDDLPVVTLTLPPTLAEGASPTNNASITFDRAATVAVTFTFAANPSNELTLPSSVQMLAGQTQVAFNARAVDDARIDGSVSVTVTTSANGTGIPAVSAQTTTIDNETKTLGLTLPATLQEGANGSGTVTIPGTLPTPLDVTLANSAESALTVPPLVTIPAGQTQATFAITTVDNILRDGTRTANITATASAFTSATKAITVRDNDVATYRFGSLPDIVNVTSPVGVTISAVDVEGNTISGFAGTVNLFLVLPDGSTQPLAPATVTLAGATGFTGTVTLPVLTATPLRLRATDTGGYTGDSTPFDVMRVMTQAAADLVWDAARGRIYATVPASAAGSYSNKVIAIDPVSMQVTGSAATNQDPLTLAMTSGGEFLYAALNGNGTVARIALPGMTVASTFAIGVDSFFGTIYAGDMCTVAGQPNVLLVSRNYKGTSPSYAGLAAYDNGVMRSTTTPDHTGSNLIEPSADPTLFFGYNSDSSESGFRRLKLDASGVTELSVNNTLVTSFSSDMRSDGNKVFFNTGIGLDGAQQKRLGVFSTNGPVRPDSASNRVYYVETSNGSFIAAHDPATFNLVRRLSLPSAVTSPANLIRWGANGLAYRVGSTIVLINSTQLVPTDPPADLAVTVQATPNPVGVSAPLVYTVNVTNQGLNLASNTRLSATLSDSQTLQNVFASTGVPSVNGLVVTLPVGDLAAGNSATLTLTTLTQSAGSLSCTAIANSNAVDPDFSNNIGFKLVSVGFQPVVDSVAPVRFTATTMIYDPTRDVIWMVIPSSVAAPLGKSVVTLNPRTGLFSDPIPLTGVPASNAIALSTNGRYLYIGLSDINEVNRIDLSATPPTVARVPLGSDVAGYPAYAEDLEVLDGDGTAFLAGTSTFATVMAFDGFVRRTNTISAANRIERTSVANVFIGFNNTTSSYPLYRLSVTASGVSVLQTVSNVVTGFATEIRTAGNLVLSSSGQLVDSTTLALKSNFGLAGRPCMDVVYPRAYLVNGNTLRGYDTGTGASTGNLALPTTSTGDWARNCIRWGLDGFAILGSDKIYVARWSSTIPATVDQNSDGISDAWAATYFGTLGINPAGDLDGDGIPNALEYLFATSPVQATANPMQVTATTLNGLTFVHVVFPRRAGLTMPAYGYEVSSDLIAWAPPASVTETVLSSQMLNGVQVETVDAAIPSPMPECAFVRLKWLHP